MNSVTYMYIAHIISDYKLTLQILVSKIQFFYLILGSNENKQYFDITTMTVCFCHLTFLINYVYVNNII